MHIYTQEGHSFWGTFEFREGICVNCERRSTALDWSANIMDLLSLSVRKQFLGDSLFDVSRFNDSELDTWSKWSSSRSLGCEMYFTVRIFTQTILFVSYYASVQYLKCVICLFSAFKVDPLLSISWNLWSLVLHLKSFNSVFLSIKSVMVLLELNLNIYKPFKNKKYQILRTSLPN